MVRKSLLLFFVLFTLCSLGFTLPILADETRTITVNAAVPPKDSNYQFSLAAADNTSPTPQGTQLEYVITYGAKASTSGFDTPITLVADWKSTDAMTNIHVLDYISGSATQGYGDTTPVVDLTNRTITWNIPSLPAGKTDQTVKFKFVTTTNYTGSNDINFTIRANMSNQYVAMDEQLSTKTYRYQKDYVGTTNTTPTPTSTTPITPTPTKTSVSESQINNVSFTAISAEQATVLIDTTNPVKVTVTYGTSSRSLPSSLATADYNSRSRLTLDDLLPGKTYYLRLILRDEEGKDKTSEIFTFQTAEKSTPPALEENIIVLTAGGNILVSDIQRKNTASQIALLTPDSDYEFTYALKNNVSLRSIDAVVRNKVLGINSRAYAQEPQTLMIPMREKTPSVYVASLKTLTPGIFEVSVRIVDTKGNLTEQKIAELKVIPHLSVLEADTKNPIPDSRVYFSFFNTTTKKYEPLSRELFKNIPNPSYTDINGISKITLPQGKYRVHTSAFGYDEQTVDFTLGTKSGEDFPQVLLIKNPTNLLNYIQYYGNALTDIVMNLQGAVSGLAFSVRFFNIIAGIVLLMTIAATILFFHLRTRVSAFHLIPYFIHHLKELFHKHSINKFCATIADENGKKISDARIATIDAATGEVVTTFVSNNNGICYVLNPNQQSKLKLLITKEGYAPKTVAIESDFELSSQGLAIVLRKGQKTATSVTGKMWDVTEHIGGLFFELSLISSIILELMFFSLFGFTKTLPFFALSLFTLLLWIFYQREKQARKVFKKP